MDTSYRAIADTFTSADTEAARLATLDAVAEAEAKPECVKCGGKGYTGSVISYGHEDDTAKCEYCGGTGKQPETVIPLWVCPYCGEDRVDWLSNEIGWITCQTCNAVYEALGDEQASDDELEDDEMSDYELRRESR